MVTEYLSDFSYFLAVNSSFNGRLYGKETLALVRPFHFADINESNRVQQRVTQVTWDALARVCNDIGISPPSFGPIHHFPKHQKLSKPSKLSGRDFNTYLVDIIALLKYLG